MQLRVPPLGESITEATISRWLKREGDVVNAGETLVELETDKITVEVPALKGGVLTVRAKAEGDVVKVGEALGEFEESASVASAPAVTSDQASRTAPAATAAPTAAAASPSSVVRPPSSFGELRAAPSAVRLAAGSGTDLSRVAGTGRGGVISKPDVIAAMSAPAPATAPAAAAPASAPAPAASTVHRLPSTV